MSDPHGRMWPRALEHQKQKVGPEPWCEEGSGGWVVFIDGVESLTGGAESMLEGDLESFRTVLQVAEWLQGAEERIIVHCSAGLHRTGVYLYVLLRVLGDTPEEALEKLGASREQTFEEFARLDFWSQAESIVRVVTGSEA